MTAATRNLLLFAASFTLLTVGGAAIAIARAPIGWHQLAVVTTLSAAAIAVIAAATLATYAADVARYRACGRALRLRRERRAAGGVLGQQRDRRSRVRAGAARRARRTWRRRAGRSR